MEIKKLKEGLEEIIRKKKGIITLTPTGSLSQEDILKEKSGDLDYILVVKEINENFYLDLEKDISKLCKSYSNKDLKIIPFIGLGPVHPIPINGKKRILLDIGLFDENKFGKYLENDPLPANSFKNYKPSLGKSIKQMIEDYKKQGRNIRTISKEDLLNAAVGIKDCIRMLNTGIYPFLSYRDPSTTKYSGLHRYEAKTTNKNYPELIFYSVIKCAMNTLRVKGYFAGCNPTDKEIVDMFEKEIKDFPYNQASFPRRILKIKKKYRSCKTPKINKEKTIRFLQRLHKYVELNSP